jgi:hypothetical protein
MSAVMSSMWSRILIGGVRRDVGLVREEGPRELGSWPRKRWAVQIGDVFHGGLDAGRVIGGADADAGVAANLHRVG